MLKEISAKSSGDVTSTDGGMNNKRTGLNYKQSEDNTSLLLNLWLHASFHGEAKMWRVEVKV